MTKPGLTWIHLVFLLGFSSVLGCGAAFERVAMEKLQEDGYSTITLQRTEEARNTFSFEAERDDRPCRGEIVIRQEMGQHVSTVTSQCEPTHGR